MTWKVMIHPFSGHAYSPLNRDISSSPLNTLLHCSVHHNSRSSYAVPACEGVIGVKQGITHHSVCLEDPASHRTNEILIGCSPLMIMHYQAWVGPTKASAFPVTLVLWQRIPAITDRKMRFESVNYKVVKGGGPESVLIPNPPPPPWPPTVTLQASQPGASLLLLSFRVCFKWISPTYCCVLSRPIWGN